MRQTETNERGLLKAILTTGLVAGCLDAIAASVNFFIRTGNGPERVFRYVASGVFGKEALAGGWGMALMGLMFHFLFAFIFTILFFIIYPKIRYILKNIVLTGVLYGIVVYSIMNFIVVPLSNTPKGPFNLTQVIINLLIIIFMVGIPIAYLTDRYYRHKPVTAW